MTAPVMNSASLEQSQSTKFDTSSGSPILPIGCIDSTLALPSSVLINLSESGVRITAGQIDIGTNSPTGIFNGPGLRQSDDGMLGGDVGRPNHRLVFTDATAPMLTIDPPPRFSIAAISYFMHRNMAVRFTAMT